jgi:hypothetical protein
MGRGNFTPPDLHQIIGCKRILYTDKISLMHQNKKTDGRGLPHNDVEKTTQHSLIKSSNPDSRKNIAETNNTEAAQNGQPSLTIDQNMIYWKLVSRFWIIFIQS